MKYYVKKLNYFYKKILKMGVCQQCMGKDENQVDFNKSKKK